MSRRDDLLAFVNKPIAYYEKYFACEVIVDLDTLDECFCKVENSLNTSFESFQAPDGYDKSFYKIAGVVCFWLRKLKPFRVENNIAENRFVNEAVAFLAGYYMVFNFASANAHIHKPKISREYFHDFIASLRYHSHSPNSSAFIFESLCL